MKTYPSLALAALLAAAPLVAGCDNNESGPPKADTSQTIQSGNNPSDQPGQSRRPGGPGAVPGRPGGAPGGGAPAGGAPAGGAPAGGATGGGPTGSTPARAGR